MATDMVRRRGNRLARALQRLDLDRFRPVVIACCAEHALDRAVAEQAACRSHLDVVVVDPDVETRLAWPEGSVLLACSEGLASVPRPFHGLVIGDAPGVLWWKVLELRESDADVEDASGFDRATDKSRWIQARSDLKSTQVLTA